MADLSVNIAGVRFKNPVITASGCFGFGREYEDLYPLSKLGGVSLKGTTYFQDVVAWFRQHPITPTEKEK